MGAETAGMLQFYYNSLLLLSLHHACVSLEASNRAALLANNQQLMRMLNVYASVIYSSGHRKVPVAFPFDVRCVCVHLALRLRSLSVAFTFALRCVCVPSTRTVNMYVAFAFSALLASSLNCVVLYYIQIFCLIFIYA